MNRQSRPLALLLAMLMVFSPLCVLAQSDGNGYELNVDYGDYRAISQDIATQWAVLQALSACKTVEEIKAVQAQYDAEHGEGFTRNVYENAWWYRDGVDAAFAAARADYLARLLAADYEAYMLLREVMTEAEYTEFLSALTVEESAALDAHCAVFEPFACDCGMGSAEILMHGGNCRRTQYYIALCESAEQELAELWPTLAPDVQQFMLDYLEGSNPQKQVALKLMLGLLRQMEITQDGMTLALLGNIPEDVSFSIARVESADETLGVVRFCVDITPTHEDGTAWQPENGEKVRITLNAAAFGVEDGEKLEIYHQHDGVQTYLSLLEVTDGLITFETDGFSTFTGVADSDTGYWVTNDTVYLDLSKGNIVIDDNGWKIGSTSVQSAAGKKFYIFQSNEAHQVTTTGEGTDAVYTTPTYDRVDGWAKYIYGNKDVRAVVSGWATRAGNAGRSATANRIDIAGSSSFDVTIDNLWSSRHQKGNSNNIDRGGINYIPSNNGSMTLHFVGDNRFGAIHYEASSNDGKIIFAGEDDATLTVASYTDGNNYWNTAIGAIDEGGTHQDAYGIVINSGCIYAGTTTADDCTAIGGGGNGMGQVTITGGTVTAIAHTSGTAIGGGIGHNSAGGNAEIVISGGDVYAYNGSIYKMNNPIPAAAIGGGSSCYSDGNAESTITIKGNANVYAESVYGVAIGGGGSATKYGGPATVNISGNATVDAKSIASNLNNKNVPAGASIGGGTGNLGGGDAIVNISGSTTITTGSIGGGKVTGSGYIGSANVTITGGETQGQVVMAAGADENCSFRMTGGTIDNSGKTDAYTFIEENGGAVFVQNGTAALENGTITGCKAENGGAIYVNGGEFTMTGSTISGSEATADGGAVCVLSGGATISAGTISGCKAENGGAIYVNGGEFTMTGGTISGSEASENGGAVYVKDTTVSFGSDDGAISVTGNSAKNGAGFYLHQDNGNTTTISNGTISSNTASVNGGGIYQTGTNGSCTVNGGAISTNSAVDGAGVYVGGGSLSVEGGEISGNTASGNGGGIYQTGANVSSTVNGGAISTNSAVDGAGVYVGGGSLSVEDGEIFSNEASGNGGGICMNGANASADVFGLGSIKSNTAVNGGGIYLIGGADLEVTGGSITLNHAVGTTNSVATAYHQDGAAGVGGGVSVASGINGNATTFVLAGNQVGIFGNTADSAADDVFASGQYTQLNVLAKGDMYINDATYNSTTGWFEDYFEDETNYASGLNGGTGGARYRQSIEDMTSTTEAFVSGSEDGNYINEANMYVCITLGVQQIGKSDLTITKSASEGTAFANGQTFVFRVTCAEPADGLPIDVQVVLEGAGSIAIKDLPDGVYTVTEDLGWAWQYNCTNAEQEIELKGTTGQNAQHSVTFANALVTDDYFDASAHAENVFD